MLAIYINGRPAMHGHKRREFQWSAEHGIYLYEGRLFEPQEFNEAFERCEKRNADLSPLVKVVDGHVEAPVAPPPAPVTTISAAREITLEEAEAVMWRMAPERMKKKTGKPPEMMTG